MKKYIGIISLALVLGIFSASFHMYNNENELLVNKVSSHKIKETRNESENSYKKEINYAPNTTTIPNSSNCKNESIYNYYSVKCDNKNNYTIILYDSEGNIVYQEKINKEPHIEFLGENIIQITISLGSPLNYTQFYDISTGAISPAYSNALLIEKDKIIYMKIKKNKQVVMVISDFFNKDIFYKEIKREFSPTAVPSSAIRGVKFIDETKLQIKYVKGKDYIEKVEIIDLTDSK